LTTPDILIWSAVSASASIPDIFGISYLYIKDKNGNIIPYHAEDNDGEYAYIDGSFSADLPVYRLGKMFNITTFINV